MVTEIEVRTGHGVVAADVTDTVFASCDGFDHARAWLCSAPHTTCSLMLCEVDDDLLGDVARVGRELLRAYEPFRHAKNDNPNARAHITSSLFGTTVLLPTVDGRPALGTYQRLVLLELDGPATRRIQVTLL